MFITQIARVIESDDLTKHWQFARMKFFNFLYNDSYNNQSKNRNEKLRLHLITYLRLPLLGHNKIYLNHGRRLKNDKYNISR